MSLFTRTVKRVAACCTITGATGPQEAFTYQGNESGLVEVTHPLGRVPIVTVLEQSGDDYYVIEPTIQISNVDPFNVTVDIDPMVDNYLIVLN